MNIPQPPPMPVTQTTLEDESHLNLLAVFHYVLGGLYLLGIGFVILHFIMMSFVFQMASSKPRSAPAPVVSTPLTTEALDETADDVGLGAFESPSPAPPAPMTAPAPSPEFPKEMIAFFTVIYVTIGAFLCALATANFMSGRFIQKRKNKTFSIVIAAINCLQIPFGTVLGVFTIIVLMRPSVQSGYQANLSS